jgi:hypothetical protein
VRPFYLSLLGANFTRPRDSEDFRKRLGEATIAISDRQIDQLLAAPEWRGRLAASWFVGLTRRSQFVGPIIDLLVASELVYAGQGYCMALALVGDEECAAGLCRYLRRYLPINGRFYNQDWAIGALAHVRGGPPAEFLDPPLWEEWLNPTDGIRRVAEVIRFLRQHRMV